MLKKASQKVEKAWSKTKSVLAAMSVWGLIFSLVTITRLAVAFDYDDTLVFSSPAYSKAFSGSTQPYSHEFWSIVNKSYDLEKPKMLVYPLAWIFRLFGFKVTILTSRPAIEADALKKEWRHLIARGNFVFGLDAAAKSAYLRGGNYVLFFGDGDSDIQGARRAKVFPVRIRRSAKSLYKEDYHPGTLGELVIPFSEF